MQTPSPIAILLCACLLLPAVAAHAETVRVAVAANFSATARTISAEFEARHPHSVSSSTASTGALVSQVLHGAPYDVLLSADERGPAALVSAGLADAGSQACYAAGRLVLLGGQVDDLANPDLSLAIANPLTAPYGRAAEQVLQRPEFAIARERKLLRGSNVLQAYQFWIAGADLALVADALAPGQGVPVPEAWYEPIEQHAVLLANGQENAAAADYLAFLHSSSARDIIRAAGYGDCP